MTEKPQDRRPSVTRLQSSLRRQTDSDFCLPIALMLARHLRFDAADPQWADRDRVLLSGGLAGLAGQVEALLGTHGVFVPSGVALGEAVGAALAERILAARFGRSLVDHRTWALLEGAELARGAVQEAACLAGAWRLGRLTAITCVESDNPPGLAAFASHGWAVRKTKGAAADVAAAISAAIRSERPTLIACLPADEPEAASAAEPVDEQAAWVAAGRRAAGPRRAWLKRLARHAARADFEQAVHGRLSGQWHAALSHPERLMPSGQQKISPAATLAQACAGLAAVLPELCLLPGLSGWRAHPLALPQEWAEARSLAVAGLTLGMSATVAGAGRHGALLALATGRLDMIDAARLALRQGAMDGIRMVYFLQEPASSCPIGGLQAPLRAMDNVFTFRPADACEALECLELALRRTAGPSILLVSEHAIAPLHDQPSRTRSARGGYIISEPVRLRAATLIASGSDLSIALRAAILLGQQGVPAAVVSLPCWNLFAGQPESWRETVLGTAPRYGLEAGSGLGWERWLGQDGMFIDTSNLTHNRETAADHVAKIIARAAPSHDAN